MQILTTQAELRNARHVTGQGLFWRCADCGTVAELGATAGCGTGYGYDARDMPICYECCGKADRAQMMATGKATLYLTGKPGAWSVSNWPGTLRLRATVRKGRHNIARTRYDAWFTGPDGLPWHGVTYGENTQICHCRRLKQKAAA